LVYQGIYGDLDKKMIENWVFRLKKSTNLKLFQAIHCLTFFLRNLWQMTCRPPHFQIKKIKAYMHELFSKSATHSLTFFFEKNWGEWHVIHPSFKWKKNKGTHAWALFKTSQPHKPSFPSTKTPNRFFPSIFIFLIDNSFICIFI
jgi:hypothetical protein